MRAVALSTAIFFSTIGLCTADGANAAATRVHTNIPSQPLATALQEFERTRNMQVLYFSAMVKDLRSGGASGDLTTDSTLGRLLSGTGLTYRYVGQNTVAILRATGAPGVVPVSMTTGPGLAPIATTGSSAATSKALTAQEGNKEGKTSSSDRFRVAEAAQAQNSDSSTLAAADERGPAASTSIQEVVVTAQKTSEPLLRVPVPVTALSTDSLVSTNQLTLQDYYTQVPSLSVIPGSLFGGPTINIRGIGALGGQPTVGVTLDDVQFQPSGALVGANVPEIDPEDLQQIEVLRGPQGTLYGANSMGGLIRYVTVSPSTSAFSAHVTAGANEMSTGKGVAYNFSGSVNMPINQDWAVRASAFARSVPGWINDPVDGAQGINSEKLQGGRLSSLWKISDSTTVKLDALLQKHTANGADYVTSISSSGQLMQSTPPNSGGYTKTLGIYDAIINSKLGPADLTSVTAYSVLHNTYLLDFSFSLGPLAGTLYPGYAGVTENEPVDTGRFTQELRASMPLGQDVDWMLGFFYAHENNNPAQTTLSALNFNTGARPAGGGLVAFVAAPTFFRQYAAFTNLTWRITSKFDIQMGLRENKDELQGDSVKNGPLFGNVTTSSTAHSNDTAFTYSFTPRYKITPDTMVYFRAASGFRPGGFNSLGSIVGVPSQYGPDKTKNYELGVKSALLDHRLTLDASVYHIDWTGIQLSVLYAIPAGGKTTITENAGEAKSDGVELTAGLRPWQGFSVDAMFDYDDAVLAKAFPPGTTPQAPNGERLPGSTKMSANLSVDQVFPVGALAVNIGGSASYQGNRSFSLVGAGTTEQFFPSYVQFNLHVGASYESWRFSAYANNVTDKRAIIVNTTISPTTYLYIQPRTVGLSVTKQF